MIALVDESIGVAGDGFYVVAMVLIATEQRDIVRRRVRHVMPSANQRFHFHRESAATKLGMLGLLGEVAAHAVAYRITPAPTRHQNEARDRCLNAMAADLGGVTELLLESRDAMNDVRDRRVIAGAVRRGLIAPGVEYGHRRPREEPLLWLADALAGAVLADGRHQRRFFQALPDGCATIHENP